MKYEYVCKECRETFSATQSMKDDPLVDCPSCGKPALQRVIHKPPFSFKNSVGVFGKSKVQK